MPDGHHSYPMTEDSLCTELKLPKKCRKTIGFLDFGSGSQGRRALTRWIAGTPGAPAPGVPAAGG